MQQEQTQSQQMVTPEAIGLGTAPMYVHYPPLPVYQRQMPVADQFRHNMQQQYGEQQQNATIIHGQGGNQ
eukprot:1764831-Ditylum_brightwellii.AAC.1